MALAGDDSAAPRCESCRMMRTWTASTRVAARPAAVLEVLTDPGACERGAPVVFDVAAIGATQLTGRAMTRIAREALMGSG
jgi:hypothetical protein